MPSPRRFLAVVLVMLAAFGVLAAAAAVVRHNTRRAAATVGAVAASASPTPPPDQIAGFGNIHSGEAVRDKVLVYVTLRTPTRAPVHFQLQGATGRRFDAFIRKPPYYFPENATIWDTHRVPDGPYTLTVRVGSGPVERRVSFRVANGRR